MEVTFQLIGRDDQWNLSQREITIGRDPACDLVIPAEFVTVSRRHCKMNVLSSEWSVIDNNSANGIYLNGLRVQTAKVYPGDTLQLGANGPELRVDLGMGSGPSAPLGDRGSRAATILARRVLDDGDNTQIYTSTNTRIEQFEEPQPVPALVSESDAPIDAELTEEPEPVSSLLSIPEPPPVITEEPEPMPEPVAAAPPEPVPLVPDPVPQLAGSGTAALNKPSTFHHAPTRIGNVADLDLPPIPPPSVPNEVAKPAAKRNNQTMVMSSMSAAAQTLAQSPAASPWKPRPAAGHEDSPSVAGPYPGITPEEEEMIEKQLKTLKALVTTCLVVIVVLAGVVFYQQQQISNNRQTLIEMRSQAENAVGQFTPTLDKRLSRFEDRMDQVQEQMNGLDAKMKTAEDRFISRLNSEVPAVLDRYIDKKSREVNAATPTPTASK